MPLTYLPSPNWAVVYGEVPSATRWSELGLNDNSLATGAGFDSNIILARHYGNASIPTAAYQAASVTPDIWTNPYKFRAYRSAGLTSISTTPTKCPLNIEDFDTNNNYNNASYQYIAPIAGTYLVTGRFSVATSSVVAYIMVYKNGIEVRRGTLNKANAEYNGVTVADIINLAATDYIELFYCVIGTLAFELGTQHFYFSGILLSKN